MFPHPFRFAVLFTLAIAALPHHSRAGTQVAIRNGRWELNSHVTYPGTAVEGLLMNVRMVNATFEDRKKPDFDPEANTAEFLAKIPDYVKHGVRAFTLCLQGGMPGYEGAVNSAFNPDGSLRAEYLKRVERVVRACDQHGAAVILGLYYQRQSKVLRDEAAVRAGVVNVALWVRDRGFTNVVLEIANEYPHGGFRHSIIRKPGGQASLIRLARKTVPGLLVSASGAGGGGVHAEVAEAADFLMPHWNHIKAGDIPARVAALKGYHKPIVVNEDDRTGKEAVAAMMATVKSGAGYGLMLNKHNQTFPFHFDGAQDDPVFYRTLLAITSARAVAPQPKKPRPEAVYFPPPESKGGWRSLKSPKDIETIGGMDPRKLDELREWLLKSDNRPFAAVVIRHGHVVLQVERQNSAVTDAHRVASVSKAVCATVLAIASERSQKGQTPRKMSFDDPAFQFIPWAKPLSDLRKAKITVKQLLNHTSGLTPEATGATNRGPWRHVLGHDGDPLTAKLAFDPGTKCGYSTFALYHASLVCENVTGKPYDQFAIEALFKPLGIERWSFEFFDGGDKKGEKRYGRHPSHSIGMPARELARIAYCMLHNGLWQDKQVVPKWFVEQTAAPTHTVKEPELRFHRAAQSFSHGWELPARLTNGKGIPADARYKPGSGGQLMAFVPSLDLVIARQTGSSGTWQYEEYLRRACAAVLRK
jgi:CubicO group peptidase (beta-lactamase class C family)